MCSFTYKSRETLDHNEHYTRSVILIWLYVLKNCNMKVEI